MQVKSRLDRFRSVFSLWTAGPPVPRRVLGCSDRRNVPCTTTIFRSSHPVAAAMLFLLATGTVLATPAAGQDRLPIQRPESIRGTVINGVTGEPISRALVFTPDQRFGQMTDSEGHFDYALPKVDADGAGVSGIQGQGQFQFEFCCIQARKPGFLSDPNQEQGADLVLGSEPVIALIPEGLIKGRVSLPSSDAASGVAVELYSRQVQDGTFHWMHGSVVKANSNGEFRFAELRPGEYKIVTHELMDTDPLATIRGSQLYGYPPVYYPGAVDFNAASPIQIKAGQTFEADLSPLRQPYYPVRIPVADEVENAMITVSVQGHASPGYSLGYRSERHSVEGFLPNGTYVVSMESFGLNGASGAVTLTVSGGPAQGSSIVLSRHRSIQLNVTEDFLSKNENRTATWSDGKRTFEFHGHRLDLQVSVDPVDDLNERGGRSIRPPAGPSDDSLVIDDVAPGRYRLRLFASRGYVASATSGGVDLLQEPLVVTSGGIPSIDIRMRDDFAEIDGSLANGSRALNAPAKPGSSGRWRSPAYVYLVPQPGSTGQFMEIGTDGEGKFNLTNVAPGKYLVLAFPTQQMNLPYHDVEAMRAYERRGQTVQLAPGQKERLELQVISGTE